MNYWQIYTKDGCGYCKKAKALLKEKEKNGDRVEILDGPSIPETIKKLQKKYNHYTYPIIFKNDEFIGGYDQLQKHL